MQGLKTILITGASRGIGLGLTKHLLETVAGVRVIATYRSDATATKLFELSSSYPKDKLFLLQLDTTSEQSYKTASDELAAAGVTSLDILIANAGVAHRHNTLTCPPADALEAYNTNVVGSMLTVQAFHGLLTSNKEGAKLAVFTSSVMGSIEKSIEMQGGAMAYRASKAALNMMAACYAEEQAKNGVKVVALHPGWVQTEMGGGSAPLTVEDSVQGITQILLTAAQMQFKSKDVATPAAYKTFEDKLKNNNIVFAAFDGSLLPW